MRYIRYADRNAAGNLLSRIVRAVREESRIPVDHIGVSTTSPHVTKGYYEPVIQDGKIVLGPGEKLVRLDTGQELTPEEARDLRAER